MARSQRRGHGILRGSVPAGTWPIIVPVCTAAGVVFGLAFWEGVQVLWGPAVALLLAAILAERFPVPIEGVRAGETSFANVFIVTAAVIYGWQGAVVIAALSMLAIELYRRTPPVRLLFNTSLYALSAGAAGLAARPIPDEYRIGLLSALAFYVVDVALLAGALSLAQKKPYLEIVRAFFLSTLAPFAVMAATAAILVRLWLESPWWGLLLVPPLVAVGLHQRSLLATVARQRELDQMKDELVAVISHELRTPLASVYGAAVTLEERQLDEETRRQLIGVIRRESARQTKIVSDVLWASRVDAEKAQGHPVLCDAAAIVKDVATTAAGIAPANIAIEVDVDGSSELEADPEQLRLVLANLVDNAVKYSPGGGTIGVSVHQENGQTRFCVTDEGLGIEPDDRERIFEKFTRLDPEMRGGIGGTGLGLYICRELVDRMGGLLWVRGNTPRGSMFIFELPTTKGGKS